MKDLLFTTVDVYHIKSLGIFSWICRIVHILLYSSYHQDRLMVESWMSKIYQLCVWAKPSYQVRGLGRSNEVKIDSSEMAQPNSEVWQFMLPGSVNMQVTSTALQGGWYLISGSPFPFLTSSSTKFPSCLHCFLSILQTKYFKFDNLIVAYCGL